jgi:diaminopimelate decarboxylase
MPSRGDLLAFENAGAYGYTESMPLFLSHEWPAEVGVRKGRVALLRRPPRVADLQARQETPF